MQLIARELADVDPIDDEAVRRDYGYRCTEMMAILASSSLGIDSDRERELGGFEAATVLIESEVVLPGGPLLVPSWWRACWMVSAQNSVNIPRIARRVQLPAFEYDAHHPYIWPRSSSVDAGSLMFRAISELVSRSA